MSPTAFNNKVIRLEVYIKFRVIAVEGGASIIGLFRQKTLFIIQY